MQDAQDPDLIPPNEIERDMLSHSKGPYTQRDRVALFAYFRSKTELLEGEFQPGDTVRVDASEGELTFTKAPTVSAAAA